MNIAFGDRRRSANWGSCMVGFIAVCTPQVENCPPFAPPYEDLKTPYGLKNQKARCREGTGSRGAGKDSGNQISAIFRFKTYEAFSECASSIVRPSMRRFARDGEAGRVEFLAAAIHAVKVGTRNPAGLFAAILRKKLWGYITQADEDQARNALRRAVGRRPEGDDRSSRSDSFERRRPEPRRRLRVRESSRSTCLLCFRA